MRETTRARGDGVNKVAGESFQQRGWAASENEDARRDIAADLPIERLPFTVTVVEDEMALDKALTIRRSAYGRHMPELAETLGQAEQHDYDPGSIILLAESKLDGEPLGTMRIQTNEYSPLWLEESVALPEQVRRLKLAEATRLGVVSTRAGRLVKIVLFKALYQYCMSAGISWMVIAARSPLDRQYLAMLFCDLFPEQGYIPMKHAADVPHRVLGLDIMGAESLWKNSEHPLYDFMKRTNHPDIMIDPVSFIADDAQSRIYDDVQRWRMER